MTGLLDVHYFLQEIILYLILGAAGIIGASVRKFFADSFARINSRIDGLESKMDDHERQTEEIRDELKNVEKGLMHIAEFEDDKIKTFHSDANFNRSLKSELRNILE